MSRYFFLSQGWKTKVKTVIGILSLLCFVLSFSESVHAFQKALIEASDGQVYQIQYLNTSDVDDFVKNFSIHSRDGIRELRIVPSNPIIKELYTAARVLAKTPRSTSIIYNTSALAKDLEQAMIDKGIEIAADFAVGKIVDFIIERLERKQLEDLELLNIKSYIGGPASLILKVSSLIAKLGTIEIEMRSILYAFWRASIYANTTIQLQTLANDRAAELWAAIDAGKVVKIAGSSITINRTISVLGHPGLLDPLRLRVVAKVYQNYAERSAKLGSKLGKDPHFLNHVADQVGIGDIIGLLSSATDALEEKKAIDELNERLESDVIVAIRKNIDNIYTSAAKDLNRHKENNLNKDVRLAAPVLSQATPEETTLLPNYPNPSNPETYIPYQLAQPAKVTVSIYATDRTLVRTLALGHQAVGIYQSRSRAAYWDGKNELGESVVSGVYFYTLTAGDFTAIRRMLIRK